jgi:hypothetical protein
MFGLKFLSGSRASEGITTPEAGAQQVSSPQRRRVKPARRFHCGRCIAVAIDDDAIQLATAGWLGTRRKLLDARKLYFSSAHQVPEAREEFISSSLHGYFKEWADRNTEISVVAGGSETAFRTLLMPDLPSRQLDAAVGYEAKVQVPFPVKECEYDYRVVEQINSGPDKRLRISLLAATKTLLSSRIDPLDDLSGRVEYAYHSQEVIGYLLRELPEFSNNRTYVLVNIERDRSEIAYYRGTTLEFFHTTGLGSSFLGSRSDSTSFDYFAESLAGEIQSSIDYYTGQFSGGVGDQVYVFGDLAYSDDLIERLTDRFGLGFDHFPVESLSIVRTGKSDIDSALSVCLPVIAAACCPVKAVDLLPAHRKEERSIKKVGRLGAFGLASLCLVLLLAWSLEQSSVRIAENRLERMHQDIETFRNSAVFKQYSQLKRQIALDQAYLQQTHRSPSYMSLNLKELSRLTPESIRLLSFDFGQYDDNRNLYFIGVIRHDDIPPEVVLAEYVASLNESDFYSDVTVVRHNKRKVRNGFELEFQISARGVV